MASTVTRPETPEPAQAAERGPAPSSNSPSAGARLHWQALDDILAEFIGARTQADAVAFFEAALVTVGPILDAAQLAHDPHVLARGIFAEIADAQMGTIPMHRPVPGLSATPGHITDPAPRLGEHNGELLARIGIDAGGLAQLRAAGIIHGEISA